MSWFRRKHPQPSQLLGRWRVDPTDTAALRELGDVAMEFDDKGNLTYTIRYPDKDQVILMTYRVEGSMIVSDQPSNPRSERTDFHLSAEEVLTLSLGGVSSRFIRF